MRTSMCLLQILLKRGQIPTAKFQGNGCSKNLGGGGGGGRGRGTSEVWPKGMGAGGLPLEAWEAKAYMYLLFVGTKFNKISDLPNCH